MLSVFNSVQVMSGRTMMMAGMPGMPGRRTCRDSGFQLLCVVRASTIEIKARAMMPMSRSRPFISADSCLSVPLGCHPKLAWLRVGFLGGNCGCCRERITEPKIALSDWLIQGLRMVRVSLLCVSISSSLTLSPLLQEGRLGCSWDWWYWS